MARPSDLAMLRSLRPFLAAHATVLFLLLALLAGGGGRGHPLLTSLIGVGALLLLTAIQGRLRWSGQSIFYKTACTLGLAYLLLLIAQILPLPPELWRALPGREPAAAVYDALGWGGRWHALSLTPDATWLALLACLPPFVMFLAAASAGREDVRLLLRIVVGAALASAALGILQFGAGAGSPFYLFETAHRGAGVGFFINRNHQASLLLIGIILSPIPGVFLRERRGRDAQRLQSMLLSLLVLMLAGALLATTSRTGVALLPIAIIGAAVVAHLGRATTGLSPWMLVCLAIVGAAVVPTAPVQQTLSRFAAVAEDHRPEYWANTKLAIEQSFPAGTGLGSFQSIYPTVEPLEQLSPLRVNNAHNDYLEFMLEAGAVGALLLASLFALILVAMITGVRRGQTPHQRARAFALGGALLVLAAASIVDYPLRMTSLMVIAAMLIGLLVRASVPAAAAAPQGQGRPAWKWPWKWVFNLVGGLLLAHICLTGWALSRSEARDGEGVSLSAPWLARGWTLQADAADLAGRPEAGIAPALRALAIAPLDSAAVRALGLGWLAQGREAQGARLLEIGARLGWRDAMTQYWLADRALRVRAYAPAVERIDALLRRDRATEPLLERLVTLVREPEARAALISALSVSPGWRQAFFNTLARHGSVREIRAVIGDLNKTAAPTLPQETALIRWKLADKGDWASVSAIWRDSHGQGLLGNGGFDVEAEALQPTGAPFVWYAPELPGAHALIAEPDEPWRGNGVMVTSDGFAQGPILAQIIVLSPGRYILRAMALGYDGNPLPLRWSYRCLGDNESAVEHDIAMRWQKVRDGWSIGSGRFEIGAQCLAQVLDLAVQPQGGEGFTHFLDNISINLAPSSR